MTIEKTTRLFNGEVIVDNTGLYTFAHCYRHPQTGRWVHMTGMNHVGEVEYFEQVKRILAACNLVLSEDITKERSEREERYIEAAQMRETLFDGNLDEAFFVAMQIFFIDIGKALKLPMEDEVFEIEYGQPHWFSGDTLLLSEEQEAEYMESLQGKLATISPVRKQEVVEYVKAVLEIIERKEFTKSLVGEGMVFFYTDQLLVEALLEALGKPRDLHCFEEFDRLVADRNPEVIGIKFGAAHMSYQRALLEQRGYVHQWSIKMCNISF